MSEPRHGRSGDKDRFTLIIARQRSFVWSQSENVHARTQKTAKKSVIGHRARSPLSLSSEGTSRNCETVYAPPAFNTSLSMSRAGSQKRNGGQKHDRKEKRLSHTQWVELRGLRTNNSYTVLLHLPSRRKSMDSQLSERHSHLLLQLLFIRVHSQKE
jgi:hypothetical protein